MTNAKINRKNVSPVNQNDNPEIEENNNSEVLHTLKDHLLIAMPSLTDPYFKHSVVYLCEHDEKGAMGFIIN